jgi:hypothetical protein
MAIDSPIIWRHMSIIGMSPPLDPGEADGAGVAAGAAAAG